MITKINIIITITLFSIALSACNKEMEEVSTENIKAADAITITHPRIRFLPPSQKVTAMYMQLDNNSSLTRELVKIEGSISNMIELHTHKNDDGVMQMDQVISIPVPANGSTEAKPGGYHVMIMGLKKSLSLGEKVEFNLIFKDGSNKTITAEVENIEVH